MPTMERSLQDSSRSIAKSAAVEHLYAASFVVKSKEAFDDRELAVVALLPSDPHDVVTFGIPLRYYGIETS